MKKFACGLAIVVAALVCMALAPNTYAKYVGSDGESFKLSIHMPKYTVIFDANGGTGTMDPQEFTYGAEPVALTANAFEREDYVFIGWNTDADNPEAGTAYEDEEEILNLSSVDGAEITLYAQWEYQPMPVVFSQTGVCEFHGEVDGVPQPITGDDCEYAGLTYIDTGWKLYSEANYEKDFEIGFKIVEYDSTANVTQATFATAKYESGSENSGNPGFVIRKGNNNSIEISQMIRGNQKASVSFPASSITEVKIARVDEKVYYSINGGDYVQLQSNVGTSDYHNIPMWFGAAPTNVIVDGKYVPHRYLIGKLSDIYIKVGNYDSMKRTVTYHANGEGATVSPEQKVYIGDSSIGAMPVPVRTGHAFEGWYTAAEGGTKVRESYRVTEDIDLYAHWSEDTNICEVQVGGNVIRDDSIIDCIAAAGTSEPATITVLVDIYENVTVTAGQNITFNLGDNIWSDRTNGAVITNNGGKIHINSGTFTSARNDAVINNNKYDGVVGELYITGGNIVATGGKQAVYNKGGYVEISGDAYLSATSSSRAALQNLDGGEMVILGGTIKSTGHVGLNNESSALSLRIGIQGDGIGTTPVIQGATNGVLVGGNFEFYDGILIGGSAAVSNRSKIAAHDGTLTDGTTEIDGVTYHTLYNE